MAVTASDWPIGGKWKQLMAGPTVTHLCLPACTRRRHPCGHQSPDAVHSHTFITSTTTCSITTSTTRAACSQSQPCHISLTSPLLASPSRVTQRDRDRQTDRDRQRDRELLDFNVPPTARRRRTKRERERVCVCPCVRVCVPTRQRRHAMCVYRLPFNIINRCFLF